MSNLLLQTKLFRPALRPSLITRSLLIDRLNVGLDHARLTLVSAPAGFGKTTLVTAWLAQLAAHTPAYASEKIAWLSLDENDNDLVRFLTYLTAALQTAVPHLGETAVHTLQSPQPPPPETVLTLLINDISRNNQPLILVLDDYHVVTETAVHQALAFLLDHLPPQLHLLITTRSDPALPLSRLRARSQMIEIRTNELRFSLDETQLFFNQVMNIMLSHEETMALEQRTEGWIAGLQLAALSLKGRSNQAERIAAFTGSHRFIIDYLTEEVLNRQEESIREFLLATSILERVCGPLGDVVAQANGSQEILEYLEQSNLFLIPLDEERRWYRYHHLFAEVLQQRLKQTQAGQLPELHRRASEWLNQNGLLHEAINHALAGHDFEQAAQFIEHIHSAKWQSGEISTIHSWLAAMPAASWRAHPRLWLVQAWADMTVGDFREADEKLRGGEAALALLDEALEHSLRPEVLAFRACYASLINGPNAVELAQQALKVLPETYWLRGILMVFLGGVYYALGDLKEASTVLAQAPGSILSPVTFQPHQIHLLTLQSMVHLAKGKLQDAELLLNQALAIAEPEGKPIPFVGTLFAYMAGSILLYEQNELEKAETILTRCLIQAVKFGSAEVQVFALNGLLGLSLGHNDLAATVNYTTQVDALLQTNTFTPRIMAYIDYNRFQLMLKQGNLGSAAAWIEAHADQKEALNSYAFDRLALPQLLIIQGQFDTAVNNLILLIQEAQDSDHGSLLIKAIVLQAVALQGMGKSEQALTTLEHALLLAEPEGFSRTFIDEGEPLRMLLLAYCTQFTGQAKTNHALLDYANGLLTNFSRPIRPMPQLDPFFDPLSERELEVLRLVADGASNRDIAKTLFLAVPTVKKHVSNILSKLNAASRTQAVVEARMLSLL